MEYVPSETADGEGFSIPASMSNNLVYIWSDSKIITPENCRSVMRRRANVCGEYCQQQSLFLLHNPLTHNLASHMRSPPVLRRPISWEVEYSQLNYWLEYPPHTCGNDIHRIEDSVFFLFGSKIINSYLKSFLVSWG